MDNLINELEDDERKAVRKVNEIKALKKLPQETKDIFEMFITIAIRLAECRRKTKDLSVDKRDAG
jgi:hypothetical protein